MRPTGNRILVERLEGHGIERVTDGGIVIPATSEGHARTKADMFRARVLDMSDEADEHFGGDLTEGDVVLVHTWHGTGDKLYTGDEIPYGTLIVPDDIVCVVDEDAKVQIVNTDMSKDVQMKFERPRGVSKKARAA